MTYKWAGLGILEFDTWLRSTYGRLDTLVNNAGGYFFVKITADGQIIQNAAQSLHTMFTQTALL